MLQIILLLLPPFIPFCGLKPHPHCSIHSNKILSELPDSSDSSSQPGFKLLCNYPTLVPLAPGTCCAHCAFECFLPSLPKQCLHFKTNLNIPSQEAYKDQFHSPFFSLFYIVALREHSIQLSTYVPSVNSEKTGLFLT